MNTNQISLLYPYKDQTNGEIFETSRYKCDISSRFLNLDARYNEGIGAKFTVIDKRLPIVLNATAATSIFEFF